jgi:hypothetical protein
MGDGKKRCHFGKLREVDRLDGAETLDAQIDAVMDAAQLRRRIITIAKGHIKDRVTTNAVNAVDRGEVGTPLVERCTSIPSQVLPPCMVQATWIRPSIENC